ncbi:MAG: hypothetical protein KAV87_50105 [Desulfobacteraceae bacterium]|nr:hypothetical protein [Desulfobacteraceae bacterium]
MGNELRCERCGETLAQHCRVDHPCEGFLQLSETKYETFGDFVFVGDLSQAQAAAILQEQIDCRVPKSCQSFVTKQYHSIPYAGVRYLTWTFKKETK